MPIEVYKKESASFFIGKVGQDCCGNNDHFDAEANHGKNANQTTKVFLPTQKLLHSFFARTEEISK